MQLLHCQETSSCGALLPFRDVSSLSVTFDGNCTEKQWAKTRGMARGIKAKTIREQCMHVGILYVT